ncbi:GNAT family N-acyltransferase [Massilia sp. R2A-15]|uniref:GNAT family N-acetyltransferase n=1 Tax=Massilia sp. R2A-15 TaxID=3064278 RepID=UPI0027360D5A|nr:GNAT family N-acyltransferase [Massilia sp. R2A-15]WLI91607.1 GNAT family N-acyltransferase [Massilia sp. R2A-15]
MTLELATAHSRSHFAAPLPARQADWRFEASWAGSEAEVREAQRLRHAIFAGEMGARLAPPPGTPDGHDADRFDGYCDHLLVRACEIGADGPGQLVGTYRVLGPDAARRAGACYTESEFDLAPLAALRDGAVELGRACVHADWRSGGVILALWSELGKYMVARGLHTMFGCASIGMADGGQLARRVWGTLRDSQYMVAPDLRIRPLNALPMDVAPAGAATLRDMPPLIKGYLRCGARVVGPPSFDREFNTADLPIMMRLADLPERYGKQFLARR